MKKVGEERKIHLRSLQTARMLLANKNKNSNSFSKTNPCVTNTDKLRSVFPYNDVSSAHNHPCRRFPMLLNFTGISNNYV